MYKIGMYYSDISGNYYQCVNIDVNKNYVWMKNVKGVITKHSIYTSLFRKVSFFKRSTVKMLFN